MLGYKGFDKDLKCRGKQYIENTVFEEDKAEICKSGMHFCETPFDVWEYYPPCDGKGNMNRFAKVESLADVKTDDDKKYCTTKLKVNAALSLSEFVKVGVEFLLRRTKGNKATNTGYYSAATNTGDRSAATNTGYCSAATNTGDRSAATNTGDYSAATNTGDYSVATNTGNYSVATNTGYCSVATNTGYYSVATNTGYYSAATNTGDRSAATNTGDYSVATNTGDRSAATNTGDYSAATVSGNGSIAITLGSQGKAKGSKDCWIVCVERDAEYDIIAVKTAKVDGVIIKEDTFYTLKDGEFIEIEE